MSNGSWNWPEELDALKAAPQHHVLLFENERVRVLETRVPHGHTVPLHTHKWPGLQYILSWSDFVRRDHEEKVVADSRALKWMARGTAVWSEALPPHTLENVGDDDIHVISVELKNNS